MYINVHKIAKHITNNQRNTTIDISGNKNNKSNNNDININLPKFGIYTIILFVDNIKKTRKR